MELKKKRSNIKVLPFLVSPLAFRHSRLCFNITPQSFAKIYTNPFLAGVTIYRKRDGGGEEEGGRLVRVPGNCQIWKKVMIFMIGDDGDNNDDNDDDDDRNEDLSEFQGTARSGRMCR